MQKKIIALAVASALAVPAVAMAEATVYGQLNMAYEMTNTGSSSANAETSNVASNESRLGLKGSEDLGNGLSVLWQMEGDVNGDTGTESLFNRNTFAGLSGDFGTVILGNHDTPYKSSTRKMDAFMNTIADNRHMMGGSEDRFTDMIHYTSPDFNGLSVSAAMVGMKDNTIDKTHGELSAHAATVASATSISANYARDNYTATVATATTTFKNKADATQAGDQTATKVAGSYNMDALTVGLIYAMTSDDVGGTKEEQNHTYLSAKYKVSDAGTVKLAYTMVDASAATVDDGATQVALGYDHKLSDNTSVYALYTSVANDADANNGLGKPGSTAGFDDDVTNPVEDPSAIAIGVRMSF